VTWSGGSLPDEYFDQFVLSTFIAGELPPDTRIYFPVTQKCATGELRWSEVPAEDQDPHSLEHPAPGLALVGDAVKKQDKVAGAMAVAGGAIEIGEPWTRPVNSAGGIGAGYAIITNNGTDSDVLVGASSDVADRVEVHETSIDDKGVASMKKLGSVPLQSGQSVELKPGGKHIMFIGLKEPQKEGGVLKAKLKFKKAGDVDVEFAVKADGSKAAGGHEGHEHMHHDH
jgi:copper(I)-binding protein